MLIPIRKGIEIRGYFQLTKLSITDVEVLERTTESESPTFAFHNTYAYPSHVAGRVDLVVPLPVEEGKMLLRSGGMQQNLVFTMAMVRSFEKTSDVTILSWFLWMQSRGRHEGGCDGGLGGAAASLMRDCDFLLG